MAKQWLSSVFQVGALLFSKKYNKTKKFCCVQLQARKQHKHTTNDTHTHTTMVNACLEAAASVTDIATVIQKVYPPTVLGTVFPISNSHKNSQSNLYYTFIQLLFTANLLLLFQHRCYNHNNTYLEQILSYKRVCNCVIVIAQPRRCIVIGLQVRLKYPPGLCTHRSWLHDKQKVVLYYLFHSSRYPSSIVTIVNWTLW